MKDNKHCVFHHVLSERKWCGLLMAEDAKIYGCCGGDDNLHDGSIMTLIRHPTYHFLIIFHEGFFVLVSGVRLGFFRIFVPRFL